MDSSIRSGLVFTVGGSKANTGHVRSSGGVCAVPVPCVLSRFMTVYHNGELMDRDAALMAQRVVLLDKPITDKVASNVIARLLLLQQEDPKGRIQMYINSPGGSVLAGNGILDVMQDISCPVSTICVGMAASMASVILAAGEKGQRFVYPRGMVMIHQPMGGAQGQVSDIEINYRLIKVMQKDLYETLSAYTGQPYEKIAEDCDRDNWMNAAEAVKYGLVDAILKPTPPPA